MKLENFFQMQKELDNRIVEDKGLQNVDLLDKKCMATIVEIAELSNEWRGFKYWSANQEPRTWYEKECQACTGKGYLIIDIHTSEKETCTKCDGTGYEEQKNPLLEEYVDGLHFILSIGNDLGIRQDFDFTVSGVNDIMTLFAMINRNLTTLWWEHHNGIGSASSLYITTVEHYLRLGELLGFTWEEIENAYMDKNKVNYERQEQGY